MASAPKLDSDIKSSLAEKGQKQKSPVITPAVPSRAPSPDISVPVQESESDKGFKILAKAVGLKTAGRKSRKQKKRVSKKTQKRRGRK